MHHVRDNTSGGRTNAHFGAAETCLAHEINIDFSRAQAREYQVIPRPDCPTDCWQERVTETLGMPMPEDFSISHGAGSESSGLRPLDVLILTAEAPPIVSGISTCIGRLATGLSSRGHRVEVLSSAQIPAFTLGEFRVSSFVARWPRIARRLGQFDVVNLHGPVPTLSDAFLKLSVRLPDYRRSAVVYTHHSSIDIRGASRISAQYNRFHDLLAMRADQIVTSSQHHASPHWRRYGPPVQTIPWGTDVRSSPPSRPNSSSGTLKVLFVGQMRSYKGVETLLAAVADQPQLKLTLVGGGAKINNYTRLARRLGATNAQFLGRLTDDDLQAQYDAHDVVVLPSVTRAEAFGLVLLEGMAAGCVPIASDLPGVRDVAGPTGVLVAPGDPDALRDALIGLADDTKRLEALQANSWIAAQALSWERCVASYERVLFAAARSRYVQLHGISMLPDVDHQSDDNKEIVA